MASFKDKIKRASHPFAYALGVEAFYKGLAMDASPYDRGSKPDEDWVDGYLDAMFLRKL
jgi:hypothetical protein